MGLKKKSNQSFKGTKKVKARQRPSEGRSVQHSYPLGERLRNPREGLPSEVDTAEDRMDRRVGAGKEKRIPW